jgi:hypothetical protein
MKITKTQLNQIIKEELKTVLSEVADIDRETMLPLTPKGMRMCATDRECSDRVSMTNREIVKDPAAMGAIRDTDVYKYAQAAWQKAHTAKSGQEKAALAQSARSDHPDRAADPRTTPNMQGDLRPAEQDIERVTNIEQLHDMAKTFAEKGDIKLAAAAKKRALKITEPSQQEEEAEKRAQEDHDWAGNLLADVDEFLHAMEGDLEVYDLYSDELRKAVKEMPKQQEEPDFPFRQDLVNKGTPKAAAASDIKKLQDKFKGLSEGSQKTLGRWKLLAGVNQ